MPRIRRDGTLWPTCSSAHTSIDAENAAATQSSNSLIGILGGRRVRCTGHTARFGETDNGCTVTLRGRQVFFGLEIPPIQRTADGHRSRRTPLLCEVTSTTEPGAGIGGSAFNPRSHATGCPKPGRVHDHRGRPSTGASAASSGRVARRPRRQSGSLAVVQHVGMVAKPVRGELFGQPCAFLRIFRPLRTGQPGIPKPLAGPFLLVVHMQCDAR